MKRRSFQTIITILGALIPSLGADGETIPATDLFDNPPAENFTLSPDGEYLAFIGENAHETMALFARNLDTGEIASWMGGGYDPRVVDYFWVSPDRLAYQAINYEGYDGIYTVNPNSQKITKLNKERVTMLLVDPLIDRDSLLVLRSVGAIGKKSPAALIEIDPVNGKTLRTYAEFTEDPRITDRHLQLFVDFSSEPRLLLDSKGPSSQWTYRSSPDADWIRIATFEDFRVLGLDPSGNGALVVGHFGQDLSGLYRYNLGEQSVGVLVFSDPTYDLRASAYLVEDVKGRPLGLRYVTDRRRTLWFSADLQKIQELLDQKIPESLNAIVAADTSRGRFLIESINDRQPAIYKYLDLENRSLTDIFQTSPKINPTETAKTETIEFQSRDGLALHGFLTRPNDGNPPYPTIVLPKQSARRRAVWEFDPMAQFFANRGYAVLQVNNRGSIGYGKHFSSDLLGDLAGMNNDLQDAVGWSIDQGLVESTRVAIVGDNLGGYAAMQAIAMNPETYRCAIAINGIYDLESDLDRTTQTRGGPRAQSVDTIGAIPSDDIESTVRSLSPLNRVSGASDTAFIKSFKAFQGADLDDNLRNLSPSNHAEPIHCPVLIIYNPNTPSKRNATPMVAALERNDVPHEVFTSTIPFDRWVEGVTENEKKETAEAFDQFYARIETFLSTNL